MVVPMRIMVVNKRKKTRSAFYQAQVRHYLYPQELRRLVNFDFFQVDHLMFHRVSESNQIADLKSFLKI